MDVITAKKIGYLLGCSEKEAKKKIATYIERSPDSTYRSSKGLLTIPDSDLELFPNVVQIDDFGKYIGIDFRAAIKNLQEKCMQPGPFRSWLMEAPQRSINTKEKRGDYALGWKVHIPASLRQFLDAKQIFQIRKAWKERYTNDFTTAQITQTGVFLEFVRKEAFA